MTLAEERIEAPEDIPTGKALFAAVLASPDDNGPRLIFADWLDENGWPNKAAFIRWHIAHGASIPTEKRPADVNFGELVIVNDLLHITYDRKQRIQPLVNWTLLRGFVEMIEFAQQRYWRMFADKILPYHPIKEVHIREGFNRNLLRRKAWKARKIQFVNVGK